MSTAFEAAFRRSGFSKAQMKVHLAAYEFIQSGGTLDEWAEIYRETAKRMPGVGLGSLATNGHSRPADARQSFANGGFVSNAHAGRVSAAPVREPTDGQRKASARINKIAALTVLDTIRVRDGRSIGNVRWYELGNLASQDKRSAILLQLVKEHANPADQDSYVRDNINAKTLARLQQKAAEMSDAA